MAFHLVTIEYESKKPECTRGQIFRACCPNQLQELISGFVLKNDKAPTKFFEKDTLGGGVNQDIRPWIGTISGDRSRGKDLFGSEALAAAHFLGWPTSQILLNDTKGFEILDLKREGGYSILSRIKI